jgi:thiosulfate/3-mercaptopyruvate sulfurtransferase
MPPIPQDRVRAIQFARAQAVLPFPREIQSGSQGFRNLAANFTLYNVAHREHSLAIGQLLQEAAMSPTPIETDRKLETLVNATWLEEHLDDPSVSVIEVDVSPVAYDEGHIPGAVLWNIYTDLRDEHYGLEPRSAIEQLVRESGITQDSTVVFYGYAPALGFWLMKLCGHADVRILNTNRATWSRESRPWATEARRPVASTYGIDSVRDDIRASLSSVKDSIGSKRDMILDVRSQLEYEGERFWPSGGTPDGGRAGRIPSSVHLPVDSLVGSDGAFLPTEELSQIFAAVDLAGDQQLTTYCTVGARAATVWFVLTYLLGRDHVRVYDGSWAEWGLCLSTPIERT